MRVLCFWNMYVFIPDRAVVVSDLMFEQLDDLDEGTPLLPPGDARLRAHCRLWGDHVRPFFSWFSWPISNTDLIVVRLTAT